MSPFGVHRRRARVQIFRLAARRARGRRRRSLRRSSRRSAPSGDRGRNRSTPRCDGFDQAGLAASCQIDAVARAVRRRDRSSRRARTRDETARRSLRRTRASHSTRALRRRLALRSIRAKYAAAMCVGFVDRFAFVAHARGARILGSRARCRLCSRAAARRRRTARFSSFWQNVITSPPRRSRST